MAKVSIKIDVELNKKLSICSILEDTTKEVFVANLLNQSLQPYIEKWERHKFGHKDS